MKHTYEILEKLEKFLTENARKFGENCWPSKMENSEQIEKILGNSLNFQD